MKKIQIVLFSEVNSKFGFPFLNELVNVPEVQLLALVTSPPGKLCDYYVNEENPVDLEEQAISLGIPVLRPESVNAPAVIQELKSLEPDFFLIANYQQIMKQDLLDVPQQETINFHPSPLPRYAGLAPFFWMARQGERNGGVTALLTSVKIDGGPILAQRHVPLKGNENSLEIRELHFQESLLLLKELLPKLIHGEFQPVPQDLTKRTYFGHPKREDSLIRWNGLREDVLRVIRASCPTPGAYTYANDANMYTIFEAEPFDDAQLPLESPGSTIWLQGKLLVAASDGWVQINTIHNEQGAVGLRKVPNRFQYVQDTSAIGT